jgi:hypothetical protein
MERNLNPWPIMHFFDFYPELKASEGEGSKKAVYAVIRTLNISYLLLICFAEKINTLST